MADIFISYAREDQKKAQRLAEALARQGWSVWWDRRIPTGRRFHQVIERELTAARCVVALWSKASVSSSWVWEEAEDGLNREILVPARIEAIPLPLPLGFRTVQTADLSDWDGNQAHLGFTQLVEDITAALGEAPPRERPGVELACYPLHFFWIIDCSDSMQGEKIEALNYAIRNSIPELQKAAESNPNAQVLVRAIRFSDSAQWHIAQPTAVENFNWTDLTAGGMTSMGRALLLLAEQLKMPPMPDRALPPVLVLVSGSKPTDDFNSGLKALMAEPWGKESVRLAIPIGQDADEEVLQRFIGHPEIRPLSANNSEDLVKFIKWVPSVVEDVW